MLPDRLKIHRIIGEKQNSFAEDVRIGLTSAPKFLLPKYFYDELGSILFEAITLLPEYYPTRAEAEILQTFADEIVADFTGEIRLLEFGSGSATKTKFIIEAILRRQETLTFSPIDISPGVLEASAKQLLETYPKLKIEAFAGDYFGLLQTLKLEKTTQNLALFLGSNIGNFPPQEAANFLNGVRGILHKSDALLLGADLKKEREILEAAYDDSLGVTSAFNLNLFARINRELGANFDLRRFKHLAYYNEKAGRIETFLASLAKQTIEIKELGLHIQFEKGEQTHTENSHKYNLNDLENLATAGDFRLEKTWFDKKERFSNNLFRV